MPTARPGGEPPRGTDPASADSFDPRTWTPGAADISEEPSGRASATRQEQAGTGPALRLAGLGVAALAGIAALYLLVRPAPPPDAAPRTPPAKAAAPALDTSRRTVMLEDSGQVLSALSSAGVSPEAASRAATPVLAALGTTPGEVRLDYRLAGAGARIRLVALDATRADGSGVSLRAAADGSFVARPLAARLRTEIVSATGE
ncbi:MAG: hypothetical protein ABWX67_02015, partial [Allosphingosinicella sp.]